MSTQTFKDASGTTMYREGLGTGVDASNGFSAAMVGPVLHDAVSTGGPLLIGAYASAAAPADVSNDGDAVRLWALRNGSLVCNLAVAGALVTGSAGLPVAQQGTWNIATVTTVTTVTTVSTVTTCSTLTGSGVAHDSVDSGNPHKIGARATASVLGGTPVSAADRTDLLAGTDGVLINRPHTSLEDIISEQKTNTDGASTAMTGAFAATASQRIYLTTLVLCNSSASNITVDIRDGSAGAVLATFPVPAGGGMVCNFPVPLRFSAATAAAFDGSAAATTLSVTMIGFKSKA